MAYALINKIKKNAVQTTLSSGITAAATTIPVIELSRFYDADGVLITEGIVMGGNNANSILPEEITITGASGTSGAGNLTGATRGKNKEGSIGAGYAWPIGTNIGVTFSTNIYNKIKANFEALRTAGAKTIYVDAAATGVGNGTSWTDAFTTFTAANSSLPSIIADAVTIKIRKGASAYTGGTIARLISSGTITVQGEYYWNGQCAAAAVPSTTKFNVTATDGANIAAGDRVRVCLTTFASDAVTEYVSTTVKATVDKGSNVWEVELNAAADWGNISTDACYTIVKTEIGAITIQGLSTSVNLTGLFVNSAATISVQVLYGAQTNIVSCIFISTAAYGVSVGYASLIVTLYASHIEGVSAGILAANSSNVTMGHISTTYYTSSVSVAAASNICIQLDTNSSASINHCLLHSAGAGGIGVRCRYGSIVRYYNVKITSATTTGLYALSFASILDYGSTTVNDAVTPKNPAAAADPSYVS